MPQRLHQAQHAVLAGGRAEQHRTDQAFAQFAGQIVEHRVARRRNILEQLLHQRVVVIGELFQHREPGFLLAVEVAAFERHDFGSLVLAIDKGAFQRQIDETCDQIAVPDRNLPQHQRNPRRRLQGRERFADALVGAIDLVEKQEARDAEILEFAQDDLKLRQLLFVGLADHHRGIDRGDRRAHVMREFDRARAIDKSVALAHEAGGGRGEADAHLVMAGLGAGIADRSSGVDAAGAGNCAGARQYRFKKCGFTALEWAHQCDAPWTAGTSDVLSHRRLLIWSSALDWVGGWMLPLHRGFGKPEKRRCDAGASRRGQMACGSIMIRKVDAKRATSMVSSRASGSENCDYLPGRSSRLSSPAATLRPTSPSTLSGCSAIELFEPPISTLPPTPTPTAALPCAPA